MNAKRRPGRSRAKPDLVVELSMCYIILTIIDCYCDDEVSLNWRRSLQSFNHDFQLPVLPPLPLPLLVVQLEWRSFPDPQLWPRQRGSTTQCPWLRPRPSTLAAIQASYIFHTMLPMSHSSLQTKFGVIGATAAFTQSNQHI